MCTWICQPLGEVQMRVGVCIDIHFMILNLIIIAVSYEIRKLNNRHIFGLLTFNLFSSLSAAKLK